MKKPLYAKIAVPVPVKKTFDYIVPEEMAGDIAVGKRVKVSFGKREMLGCCVGLSGKTEIPNLKPVQGVFDEEPAVDGKMLRLTRWMADYYYCSWGEAVRAACPRARAGAGARRRKSVHTVPEEAGDAAERLKDTVERTTHLSLEPEQSSVFKSIVEKISARKFKVYLLHGITGSGKTEIYLQAAGFALEQGRTVIILVPEIALTPQTIERFRSRFGESVAVLHSHMRVSERMREWERIRKREARIVVGPRSAVFSPVKNLGLVVVDEEHENTYKQEDVPRYHAREVAVKRAKMDRAVVILGSATPSLESYYRAEKGEYELVELRGRIEDRTLPTVKIVDMRREDYRRRKSRVFSEILRKKIESVLKRKEQVIIFLNRRGFSTFVNCRRCGMVVRCKKCNVSLAYHRDSEKLMCHYCNFRTEPPSICPECRAGYVGYFGMGTQKVERETGRLFSEGKTARMDTDSTSRRGAHERIFDDFKRGEVEILIGTQMIAKGLDFPGVTLVGVISADTILNLPDFRAGERTFSLLTQVAGRAGRGEEQGEVIIQTYTPEHYAVQAARFHDYHKFYESEIRQRRELGYPPFSHLIRIVIRGRKEEKVRESAYSLAEAAAACRERKKVAIMGPAPLPVARVRGYYRWNVILKGKSTAALLAVLDCCFAGFRAPKGVILAVDVDPLSML